MYKSEFDLLETVSDSFEECEHKLKIENRGETESEGFRVTQNVGFSLF